MKDEYKSMILSMNLVVSWAEHDSQSSKKGILQLWKLVHSLQIPHVHVHSTDIQWIHVGRLPISLFLKAYLGRL